MSRLRVLALGGGVLAALLLGLLAADRLFPPDLTRLATVGGTVLDRTGRVVAMRPAPGGVWRFRTGVDDVAPVLLQTLLRTEDRRFYRHPGIDPLALLRAAAQDLRAGRVLSGGSTLTMQAARLLEPRRRTLASKLIEMARALQLEWRFSKREILGIWLTLAPYGGNLEGVEAGSMAWFGVPPRQLDAAQAALLVAIPRRPESLRPDRHADRAATLRDRILGADAGSGDVPPVAAVRLAFPRHAPQLWAALPRSPRLATTLDGALQVAMERMVAGVPLPEHAALALLVGDLSGGVLAAVSSGGALDLTRAVRSPGSAMKPFIYALAMQDGLIGPQTRLDDLPRRFGGYAPENFDRDFAGSVTATEALRRSLNLPAVGLLERVGPLRFATVMRQAGAALVLPPGADASLPLALGGAGMTLRHALGLYAALADDGAARVASLRPEESGLRRDFLQPRAAGLVADILTQPFPDGGPSGIAWKTGTSWGGRDAWAFGFDRRHVVGIWVGRADGTPLPGATGRALALPIVARVFGMLSPAPRPVQLEGAREVRASASRADQVRLLFPPPDATLAVEGSVTLRAMGGRRPLLFLVDGAPIVSDPARREAAWLPQGPGFYRLTVLDAAGGTARASVRVR